MKTRTFHLIGNAHLDPVWLWDWREGLNEGLITCRTILDLMDEFDELTFVRGEATIYQHIEEQDPATFRRIEKAVAAGRWDVVGGTMIQPDTNLPATETFARHFARAQAYFQSRFGRTARVAWAADSFGHCAGLPEIMVQAGITGFAFTRPVPETLPLAKPAFWWEGPGGSRVMGYRPAMGWYGTNRDDVTKRLDVSLEFAQRSDLRHVAVFYGLGDHGGGPSRRALLDIRAWAQAHPEVRVVHSGLHRLFDALRTDPATLPVHKGEMNFTLRGCYSSVARLKYAYRKSEAALAAAERTEGAIRSALRQPPADLGAAWDGVLFNSFHDILPGTSIERVYDDQMAWLGSVVHRAQVTELAALNALAQRVDTRVERPEGDFPAANAVLAWNPHPWPFRGHMEWEASLDYREITPYKGRPDAVPLRVRDAGGRSLPFQVVEVDNAFESADWFWRRRVVVPVTLPPLGWQVFEFGWVEGAVKPVAPGAGATAAPGRIENGRYRVSARRGDRGVQIEHDGKRVLDGDGLAAVVLADPWGSWGGPDKDEGAAAQAVLETWRVAQVATLEQGPERAALWVRLAGKRSRLELTFQLYRGRDAVDVSARLLWNERHARLKLVMPAGVKDAEFEVPGARVRRGPCGEVPGGRWVRAAGRGRRSLGFASDALYGFDCKNGALRATVARATGYAHGGAGGPLAPWRGVDGGELKFRFLLNPGDRALPQLAQALEQPPSALVVPAGAGTWPRAGTCAALAPASLQMLALKRAEDGRGLVLRVQETAGRSTAATLTWLGARLPLGTVKANTLATWRLERRGSRWTVRRSSILEG